MNDLIALCRDYDLHDLAGEGETARYPAEFAEHAGHVLSLAGCPQDRIDAATVNL